MTAERLLIQAVEATNAGDFARAAECFEQAADQTVSRDDTVAALESAARLRIMLRDVDRATGLVERAEAAAPGSPRVLRVRAELADCTAEPEGRAQAWQAVAERGLAEHRVYALAQLGHLARQQGDHAAAATRFAAALGRAAPADPLLAGELRLELAIALTAAGDHDGAAAQLDLLDDAPPVDDGSIATRVIGQRGVLAMARGDHAGALDHAERARALAVERNDVMTYLAASTLIAGLHETGGRLVDAYDTYVRARESLGALLGDSGRGMVAPAIELFEERLGPERFQEVWTAWVARRRGN
jgi:tetratricopeptide (TPR) repeat protein